MNIVIIGAGAIGSFFGAMLSKNNNVFLIARKAHVDEINKNGLKIDGRTSLNVKVEAFESVKDVFIIPDLVILAVKSYDTEQAMPLSTVYAGLTDVIPKTFCKTLVLFCISSVKTKILPRSLLTL